MFGQFAAHSARQHNAARPRAQPAPRPPRASRSARRRPCSRSSTWRSPCRPSGCGRPASAARCRSRERPGPSTATGQPRFHTSVDQLNSTTSRGESASSPKKWANCWSTASRRLGRRALLPDARLVAADEAHHDPRAAALGRDVEGHLDGADSLTAWPVSPCRARTASGRPPRTSSACPAACAA